MDSNLKAQNLVVKSFRGINDEISLDLEDFTILYGENGMGKSSFVNSLEYLFVQKLDFLSRSTIKKSAFVNENSSKKDVKIELNLDDGEYIRLKGSRKSHSSIFDDILENLYVKNGSFIVNRDRLLKFIEGTSGNRYKAVMDLLGIKKLDKIQEVLSPAIKSVKSEYDYKSSSYDDDLDLLENLRASLDATSKSIIKIKEFNDVILKDIENSKKQNAEDIEKLSRLMNKNEDEYKKYIDEINMVLNEKSLDLIDIDTDLEEYKRKLYLSDVFELEDKIEDFNKFSEKLEFNLEDDLNNVLKDYEKIASDNLKSSKYLIKTLETSRDYIKFTNSDICPICKNTIDSEDILDEITNKISQINTSNDAYKFWQKNLKSFISRLDDKIIEYMGFNNRVLDINRLANSNVETVDYSILEDLKYSLVELSEFKKQPSDFNSFDFNQLNDNVNLIKIDVASTDFADEKEEYQKIISKLTDLDVFKKSDVDIDILKRQITERENEIANKTRESEQRKFERENQEKQIIQLEAEIEELQNEIDNYDNVLEELEQCVKTAEKTFEVFTKTKEEYINNMLSEIKDDITYFYDYIHDDDEIMSPDFVVSGSKKIDVELNSFGEYVDSRSFASEGHLDTLGLCIFLAFNKQFNDLNLIVLDDVLTTVDESHKERVARLLLEEFEDYQFILTAHDKYWVDELESLCIEYNRENVIYEIEDWSLEEGPVISQR